MKITAPYPLFVDASGQPLEAGHVYIGTANLNPETSPISVYADAGFTIPLDQPLRTIGGHPVRNGSPTRVYVNAADYSITVRTSAGAMVYSEPSTA